MFASLSRRCSRVGPAPGSGLRRGRAWQRADAGSELYRGLGSVAIGGLALSALLTLLLIPPLLSVLLTGHAAESQTDAVPQATPAE